MSIIKIAASFIALFAVLSLLGWVVAIDNLKVWCDRYVAESMFKHNFQLISDDVVNHADRLFLVAASKLFDEQVINGTRSKGKVMTASKAVSITIKNDIPNYAQMTTRELKALCTGTNILNWSRLSKAALIEALIATH